MNRKPFSITLDETLVREAKKRAIDDRKTLYEFVESALRIALSLDRENLESDGAGRKSPARLRKTSARDVDVVEDGK